MSNFEWTTIIMPEISSPSFPSRSPNSQQKECSVSISCLHNALRHFQNKISQRSSTGRSAWSILNPPLSHSFITAFWENKRIFGECAWTRAREGVIESACSCLAITIFWWWHHQMIVFSIIHLQPGLPGCQINLGMPDFSSVCQNKDSPFSVPDIDRFCQIYHVMPILNNFLFRMNEFNRK